MLSPSPSLPRRWAKFALFLSRGHAPALAWWLASKDAVVRNDYREIPLAAFASVETAQVPWSDLVAAEGRLSSRALGVAFQADDLLAHGYATLCTLRSRGFTVARDGLGLLVANENFRLLITNAEEFSMLQEIFVDDCYSFHLEGAWNVLDVGANAGLASLSFASQPWCHRVIAFEPFGPTADCHAANVALNPRLAPKVSLQRIGLGERAERLAIDYHPHLRGSMSIHGLGSWRGEATAAATKVEIEVRRASTVLDSLAPELTGRPTLLKLDCEGSEFPILSDLEETGWLRRFDLIVMETHGRRPDELVERLRRSGFGLHVRALSADQTLCLVLAWRQPRS